VLITSQDFAVLWEDISWRDNITMGSNQSSTTRTTTASTTSTVQTTADHTTANDKTKDDTTSNIDTKKKKEQVVNKSKLSGVALIEYKCRKKKRAWSKCVADHYEQKFLPGKSLEPEEDCDDLFETFRQCYMKGLLKERQKKGMPPPKEGTMLHEFMEEEGLIPQNSDAN
jgi:hypothetical protein